MRRLTWLLRAAEVVLCVAAAGMLVLLALSFWQEAEMTAFIEERLSPERLMFMSWSPPFEGMLDGSLWHVGERVTICGLTVGLFDGDGNVCMDALRFCLPVWTLLLAMTALTCHCLTGKALGDAGACLMKAGWLCIAMVGIGVAACVIGRLALPVQVQRWGELYRMIHAPLTVRMDGLLIGAALLGGAFFARHRCDRRDAVEIQSQED